MCSLAPARPAAHPLQIEALDPICLDQLRAWSSQAAAATSAATAAQLPDSPPSATDTAAAIPAAAAGGATSGGGGVRPATVARIAAAYVEGGEGLARRLGPQRGAELRAALAEAEQLTGALTQHE